MSFSNTVAERSSISASIRAVFGVRPSASRGHVANREQHSKFGVDHLEVAHVGSVGPHGAGST